MAGRYGKEIYKSNSFTAQEIRGLMRILKSWFARSMRDVHGRCLRWLFRVVVLLHCHCVSMTVAG